MQHPSGSLPVTAYPAARGASGPLPDASTKGGVWHTTKAEVPSPKVSPPGPIAMAHSPDLPAEPPWLRTLTDIARFEQRVLYGCGPAQVGFGNLSTSFLYLTVCPST